MKKLICFLILALLAGPLSAATLLGGNSTTVSLAAGRALTVTCGASSGCTVNQLPVIAGDGDPVQTAVAAGTATVFGPLASPTSFQVNCSTGSLTYADAAVSLSDYATTAAMTAAISAALADYALLAGDADGQTIQGITGENKARLDLQSGSAAIYSSYAGATESSSILVDTGGVTIESEDTHSSSFQVSEARISIVSGQTPPTNANDACAVGDFIPTINYIYYCVATNTWQRAEIFTWMDD